MTVLLFLRMMKPVLHMGLQLVKQMMSSPCQASSLGKPRKRNLSLQIPGPLCKGELYWRMTAKEIQIAQVKLHII